MADDSYSQPPLVKTIDTTSSEIIVDSFYRIREGVNSLDNATNTNYHTRLNQTPTNAIEVNFQNYIWDGTLYAHTKENCYFVVYDKQLHQLYTVVLTPYLAFTTPDGYSDNDDIPYWHECLPGSYGYELQTAMRSVYRGALGWSSSDNLDYLTEVSQPYPHSKVLYKRGVGFAMSFVGPSALGAVGTYVYPFIVPLLSPWLQKANNSHGMGRYIKEHYDYRESKSVNNIYVVGQLAWLTDLNSDFPGAGDAWVCLGLYLSDLKISALNFWASSMAFMCNHEPYLAPTRYIAISCPELSKRRNIPPTTNVETLAQSNNNVAILPYNYRTAGRLNETEDYAREYSHIGVNFNQEAPQNLTIHVRDEFGQLIQCASPYNYVNDQFYDSGQHGAFNYQETIHVTLLPGAYHVSGGATRYDSKSTYLTTNWVDASYLDPNPIINCYYWALFALMFNSSQFNLDNPNRKARFSLFRNIPTNALCSNADNILMMVIRSS